MARKQSSTIWFEGQKHHEIFFDGHYHDKMYLTDANGVPTLVWEKLGGQVVDYSEAVAIGDSEDGTYGLFIAKINNINLLAIGKLEDGVFNIVKTYPYNAMIYNRNDDFPYITKVGENYFVGRKKLTDNFLVDIKENDVSGYHIYCEKSNTTYTTLVISVYKKDVYYELDYSTPAHYNIYQYDGQLAGTINVSDVNTNNQSQSWYFDDVYMYYCGSGIDSLNQYVSFISKLNSGSVIGNVSINTELPMMFVYGTNVEYNGATYLIGVTSVRDTRTRYYRKYCLIRYDGSNLAIVKTFDTSLTTTSMLRQITSRYATLVKAGIYYILRLEGIGYLITFDFENFFPVTSSQTLPYYKISSAFDIGQDIYLFCGDGNLNASSPIYININKQTFEATLKTRDSIPLYE